VIRRCICIEQFLSFSLGGSSVARLTAAVQDGRMWWGWSPSSTQAWCAVSCEHVRRGIRPVFGLAGPLLNVRALGTLSVIMNFDSELVHLPVELGQTRRHHGTGTASSPDAFFPETGRRCFIFSHSFRVTGP